MFDYDVISDGRAGERPVNFQLVRIRGVKSKSDDQSITPTDIKPDDPYKRPIVVIDQGLVMVRELEDQRWIHR